jgi:hypothetical protein
MRGADTQVVAPPGAVRSSGRRRRRERGIAPGNKDHVLGEEAHAELGLLVGHATEAGLGHEMLDAGEALQVGDLLEAIVGSGHRSRVPLGAEVLASAPPDSADVRGSAASISYRAPHLSCRQLGDGASLADCSGTIIALAPPPIDAATQPRAGARSRRQTPRAPMFAAFLLASRRRRVRVRGQRRRVCGPTRIRRAHGVAQASTTLPRPRHGRGVALGREQIEVAYALKQHAQAGVRMWLYPEDRERTLDSPARCMCHPDSQRARWLMFSASQSGGARHVNSRDPDTATRIARIASGSSTMPIDRRRPGGKARSSAPCTSRCGRTRSRSERSVKNV